MRRNAFAMLTRRAHGGSAEKSGALCLECINDEGGSVTLSKVGSLASDLYVRTNSSPKWTAYTAGTAVSLAKGDWVEFENRADCTYSTKDHHHFSMTGKIAATGEARSMINWAETLASYCYYCMFYGCTSLTAAPELPATTLANYCYCRMFYGCTSLTAAPELPATTLASYCYYCMFYGCTSLTAAPELPATTLASYCYNGMFYGCTSLTSVKVSFTAWSTGNTTEWLSGVSSTGTFTCPYALGTADTITRGVSNCPTGWNVVNPDAPATTVAFTVSGLTADSSPSGDLSVYMGDYEVDGTTTYNGTAYTRYKLAGGAYYLAHCAITSHWGFSTKAEPSTPSDCDMYGYFSTTSPTAPTAAQLQSLSWTDASGVLLSMSFK